MKNSSRTRLLAGLASARARGGGKPAGSPTTCSRRLCQRQVGSRGQESNDPAHHRRRADWKRVLGADKKAVISWCCSRRDDRLGPQHCWPRGLPHCRRRGYVAGRQDVQRGLRVRPDRGDQPRGRRRYVLLQNSAGRSAGTTLSHHQRRPDMTRCGVRRQARRRRCVGQLPGRARTLMASARKAIPREFYIARSTDGGKTWTSQQIKDKVSGNYR